MPEITSCPQCQRKLRVPDDLLGQSVKCPSCGNVFMAMAEPPAVSPPIPLVSPPLTEREPEAEAVSRSRRVRREDEYDADLPDDDYDRPRRRRRAGYQQAHRGGTVLTVGILSLIICHIILGPIAWSMGSSDLRKMREGRMDPEGEGSTKAGMICGIIGTCIALFGCLVWVLFMVAGGARGFR